MDIGPCYRCGAPAQYVRFYDESVGFFASGGEPRTCPSCDQAISALSITERAVAFAAFETSFEAPTGRDPIGDAVERSAAFKRRGRA